MGWLLAGALLTACAGPPAADDLAGPAAPLLAAHDLLLAYEAEVGDGAHAPAGDRWPELSRRVRAKVAQVDPEGAEIDTAARSLLVGYRGGVRVAHDAWAEVDAAVRGSAGPEVVAARVRAAADRTRHLDALRAAAF